MNDQYQAKHNQTHKEAVEAYQFHIQRFHTWTNYYSIFTGALFVGFYTVLQNESALKVTQSSVYKDGVLISATEGVMSISNNSDCSFLPFIIACVGLISAICWWMSTVGHYEWTKSWISIVKVNKSVYNTLHVPNKHKCLCKKEIDLSKAQFLPKFISTDKVTLFFIQSVVLSWMVLIAYSIGLLEYSICCQIGIAVIILVLFCLMRVCIYYWCCELFSSDIEGMTKEKTTTELKSMKIIIVIQQDGGMGKSCVIRAIYNELNNRRAEFSNPNFTDNEVLAEGRYKTKTIGIESMGDPNSRLNKSLQTFVANKCDVIICASRRDNPTKGEVLHYRSDEYKIIETSHYFFKQSDTESCGTNHIYPNIDLNQLYAKAIVDLVDAVI